MSAYAMNQSHKPRANNKGAAGNPLGLAVGLQSFCAPEAVPSHFLVVLRSFLTTVRKCASTYP